jgi:hypothetical protein
MTNTIQKLRNMIDELFSSDLTVVDWTGKLSPEKWSKKEVIGHLIDSAQINLQRFVRCTYEEGFKLTYEQVEWVKAQHYQQADIDELLNLWNALNIQIIRVLSNYPPDRLQAQCDTGKKVISLHTVDWLAADYVEHMAHHLKQILI